MKITKTRRNAWKGKKIKSTPGKHIKKAYHRQEMEKQTIKWVESNENNENTWEGRQGTTLSSNRIEIKGGLRVM